MKLKLFKTVGVCATALMIGVNCFALQMPNVEYKYNNSRVIISGEASEGEDFVTLQILKANKEFGKPYTNQDILVCDQVEVKDGKYSFEVEYKYDAKKEYDFQTDTYAMRVSSDSSAKVTTELELVKQTDFKSAYSALESAIKATDNGVAFEDTINNNRTNLNFGFSLTDGKELSIDAELKEFYAYAKANGLKMADESTNTSIYKTYMTAYYLNQNEVKNIDTVIDDLYIENADLLADYDSIAETSGIQEYLTTKMFSNDIKNIAELETALKKAVVLTQVRYADGSDDVKDILVKYGSEIGITNTASDSVYGALAGVDFENPAKLVEKYDELCEDSGTGTVGGDTGGGGGGGGAGGSKDNYTFEDFEKEDTLIPPTLRMSFEDLDGVTWASEAILALADKGIVNGKEEGIFAPDDNVTREEFAKILVGAMGLDKGQNVANAFSDVKANEWYSRSVNIAKNAGIVNGIGGGKFGTGMSITREDMVVMIYNALRSKGVNMVSGNVTFSDAALISDYAVSAVGALYEMGAVNGVSETEFNPKGIASRAQAAKIIYGVLEYLQ